MTRIFHNGIGNENEISLTENARSAQMLTGIRKRRCWLADGLRGQWRSMLYWFVNYLLQTIVWIEWARQYQFFRHWPWPDRGSLRIASLLFRYEKYRRQRPWQWLRRRTARL